MMQTAFPGSWIAIVWMVHAAFAVVAGLGVLFFVVWAIKHLSPQKLKTLWVWLLVVGIVGSIVTCPILLGLQTPFFGYNDMLRFHEKLGCGDLNGDNPMCQHMKKNGMMQDSDDQQEEGESY